MTKIKICGITGEDEIAALNETGVDYAGFVLYEKSKRYVTVQKARQLFEKLNKGIRKVAVTVAPERALIEDIGRAGFDLLQVHGVDAAEAERIAAQTKLPVWLAVNLRDPAEVRRWRREEYHRIAGIVLDLSLIHIWIVLDAGAYGSGKTFGWEQDGQDEMCCAVRAFREKLLAEGLTFVLAGGLNAENVAEGIRIFAPDVADVSSGVETLCDGTMAKSIIKIKEFKKSVQKTEGV